jgi:hypothetical protein
LLEFFTNNNDRNEKNNKRDKKIDGSAIQRGKNRGKCKPYQETTQQEKDIQSQDHVK